MAGSGRSGSWASACGLVVAACLLPHPTAAQSFPTRAITWVVPSSAGGVTDVSSRVIAKPLAAILGVPVIVDPRPGAGGIIATEFVANAKPDGYTILLATSGTIATNPWLYKKLTYDPIKSFKPVIALSEGSQLLVVPEASKFKTLKDLVAYAQANPGKLNFASAGAGTGQHLAMEMLKSVAGIDVAHVPFKGATPAQTALLGQDVDAAFDYPSSIRSNLEAGKLRALVALGEVRTKNAPDVPTLKESGYDATLTGWSSVVAPTGTPDDIVAKLADAIAKAQTDPDVVAYYEQNATRTLPPLRGEDLTRFHQAEMEKLRKLVAQSGATAN